MTSLELPHRKLNIKLEKILKNLEKYDFSEISKDCVDRYGWEEGRAAKVEIETKRFFSLDYLDAGNYHIPPHDVDEYWQRMILHTRWYCGFCHEIFGAYYHHTPNPDPGFLSEENRQRSLMLINHWYGFTWDSLIRNFHTTPPSRESPWLSWRPVSVSQAAMA